MALETRISSFTPHQTSEGMRVQIVYCQIDENGQLVKSKMSHTIIVLDNEIVGKINEISDWLLTKLPQ